MSCKCRRRHLPESVLAAPNISRIELWLPTRVEQLTAYISVLHTLITGAARGIHVEQCCLVGGLSLTLALVARFRLVLLLPLYGRQPLVVCVLISAQSGARASVEQGSRPRSADCGQARQKIARRIQKGGQAGQISRLAGTGWLDAYWLAPRRDLDAKKREEKKRKGEKKKRARAEERKRRKVFQPALTQPGFPSPTIPEPFPLP